MAGKPTLRGQARALLLGSGWLAGGVVAGSERIEDRIGADWEDLPSACTPALQYSRNRGKFTVQMITNCSFPLLSVLLLFPKYLFPQ
jgi:hypothetical protein